MWEIVHLVGFIIRIYHDARSSKCQICQQTYLQIYQISPKSDRKYRKYGYLNIYFPKQTMSFFTSIFMKLTVAERNYVKISGIEYHPNRSRNTETADGHFCQHLKWSVTLTEPTSANTRTFNSFLQNVYTEIHENMAKGSVANVWSQI